MGDQNAPERIEVAVNPETGVVARAGLLSNEVIRGYVRDDLYQRAITERDEARAEREQFRNSLAWCQREALDLVEGVTEALNSRPPALAEGEQPEYGPGAGGVGVPCELDGDVHGEWCDHEGEGEQPAGEDAESEETCRRCGGQNIDWAAPSPLWNAVMRGGSINGPWQFSEIICPSCFAILAEGSGIASGWRLDATDVQVELETVTPSGRTWNPDTWLWEDPAVLGTDPSEEALVRSEIGERLSDEGSGDVRGDE